LQNPLVITSGIRMQNSIFVALVQNAALLLALALVFDMSIRHWKLSRVSLQQVLIGLVVGGIGIAVMTTHWQYEPGIIFDTRSVLLSVTGLFFGPLPTIIAALMTAVFRYQQGGAATVMGISVIAATSALGLVWRAVRKGDLAQISWRELYLFGLAGHVIMLLLAFTLPLEIALSVLRSISLPVMVIYPLGTAILGKLMAGRLMRERMTRQLQDSEERYRVLTENIKDVVWVLDTETLFFRYVSPSVEALRGYSVDEVIARPVDAALTRQAAQALKEMIRERAAMFRRGQLTPDEFFRDEVEQPCRDGSTVWTEVITSYYLNELSGHVEIRGVTRDITERRKAQEAISRMNEELEQRVKDRTAQLQTVNEELEAFAYSVSHDLRAPLRSVDGFSAALEEEFGEALGKEGHHYLKRIRSSAQRMMALISDLLDLSRLSHAEIEPEPVNLSALAAETAQELVAAVDKPVWQIEIKPGMQVQADAGLMKIVMENLLTNALKFSAKAETPVIQVGVTRIGEEEVFYVRDNGIGFDMKEANNLFMPFERLHNGRDYPGTGIGLATVKRIINRHGGRLWFESTPGEGAVFYFTLGTSS
jgi:PAS domain S-box-containing protein